jgi:anti-sigma factor RsiW
MSSRDKLPDHPAELTLLDYLIGQLPPEASDQIRRHVSACRACRRTIADLSLTVDELDRLPTVAIPHDTLGFGVDRPPASRRLTRLLPALAVLLGAAAVLATLGVGRGGSPRKSAGDRTFHLQLEATDPPVIASRIKSALPDDVMGDALIFSPVPHRFVVVVRAAEIDRTLAALEQAATADGPETVQVEDSGEEAPMPTGAYAH